MAVTALVAGMTAGIAFTGVDVLAAETVCRWARPAHAPRGAPPFPGFTSRLGVTVGDAFSHSESPSERLLDLERPEALCIGAGQDPASFEGYAARPTDSRRPRFTPRRHVVQTRFGIHQLRVIPRSSYASVPPEHKRRLGYDTTARVTITAHQVTVQLPRRAHHPLLIDAGLVGRPVPIPWWDNRTLRIEIA